MRDNKQWILHTMKMSYEGVPYNFSFSPPAQRALEERYRISSIEDHFDFPIRMTAPRSVKPLYADPGDFGESVRDEFGVVWSTSKIDRGQPIVHCLPCNTLKGYEFPDASDSCRFDGLDGWCKDNATNFTVVWIGDLWERAVFMRGMENLLVDLYESPAFVHDLLAGLTDYILSTMRILFARFRFDCVALSDDYGTQRAMLMSPRDWRIFIKPCLARIYGYARDNGFKVFHHSCGNIRPVIGDMIDIGLDILHPIQPEAMDIGDLKKEFGRSLTLCGGLNTQSLLPFGTPDAVRAEVRRLKSVIGRGGGYILEPGITVQADIPIANIVAMVEEAVSANI